MLWAKMLLRKMESEGDEGVTRLSPVLGCPPGCLKVSWRLVHYPPPHHVMLDCLVEGLSGGCCVSKNFIKSSGFGGVNRPIFNL